MPRGSRDFMASVIAMADWAALQGTDVDLYGVATAPSTAGTTIISYVVPSGKTLLIYDFGMALWDGDGQVAAYLFNLTDSTFLAITGGQRGASAHFGKPKRVTAGKTVRLIARQDTGVDRIIQGHIGGVLV